MAIILHGVSAHGEGLMEMNLVNEQKIGLEHINTIAIVYGPEEIGLFKGNTDSLLIKEYMSRDNSNYYADILHSGNELTIKRGRRPAGLFNTFHARVEVYIPISNTNNITIKTTSGSIEAVDEHIFSTINIESSSGSISVNSIAAGRVSLKASSGGIRCETIKGNTVIKTASGNINAGSINGDVSAGTSSGRMELNMIAGTITAETSSGSIHCSIAENAGDVSFTTSSGNVNLNLPGNYSFNFSSKTSSGMVSTPFSEELFSPVSDKKSVQGVIRGNSGSEKTPDNNINIKTGSGSIKVNWIR
ncbi:MAG: DUF4097 domain-containing protein [Treponema sp.]|nr:DUF4097 domain-containing protein [Treponema sp.]